MTFRTFEYINDMTEADYNLHQLTPAFGRRKPDTSSSDDTATSRISLSEDEEIYAALSMNHETHMADKDTYSPSIASYVEIVVSRFHCQDYHPTYNAETSLSNYLVTTHFNSLAGYERIDLQILGWSVSYPLHVYNIMPDFRTGSPALLDLLQNIGRSYLRAKHIAIPMTTPITGSSYMTFSPLSTVYNPPGTVGSYVSTVSTVADFLYYYSHLTVQGTSRTYLILALIYDFMAYCAQYLLNESRSLQQSIL